MVAQYFDDGFHANLFTLNPQYFVAILKVKIYFAKIEPAAKNRSKLLSLFMLLHICFEYFNHAITSFRG
jgi:hypothetical protein